jgi:CubicO group peptidase (beta-lactamase class C family)
MTKPITSAAAILLLDSGELVLDAPISRYCPEWKTFAVYDAQNGKREATAPITVRNLLNHTSGKSKLDGRNLRAETFGNPGRSSLTRKQLLRRCFRCQCCMIYWDSQSQ